MFSDGNEIKLEISNRKRKRKLSKFLETERYAFKKYLWVKIEVIKVKRNSSNIEISEN